MPAIKLSCPNLRRLVRDLHTANRTRSSRDYLSQLRVVDTSISVLFELLMTFQDRPIKNGPVTWPSLKQRKPDPDFLFPLGLSAFIDFALGTRELAVTGLDGPARTLLRSAHELADFMIAFLGSKTFVSDFGSLGGSVDSYSDWKRLLTPGKLRQSASKVRLNLGTPKKIESNFLRILSHNYSLLSKASHLDYEGLVVGNLRRISASSEAVHHPTLGLVGPATAATLKILATLVWLSTKCVSALLIKNHGWRFDSEESAKKWLGRMQRLDKSALRLVAAWDRGERESPQ